MSSNCSTNPNIPCVCALHSSYGNPQQVVYPTRTLYTIALDRTGGTRTFPYKPPQFKSSREYIDVHGKTKEIDLNYPYALVIYEPKPIEHYFQTKENALLHVPKCGEWQIIYLPTGQIIYQPSLTQ